MNAGMKIQTDNLQKRTTRVADAIEQADYIVIGVAQTHDCKIPQELAPTYPVCGGTMDVHIRRDEHFVQDTEWYEQEKRYEGFLQQTPGGRTVFFELGVGFNTPGIIRFPFEQMVYRSDKALLVRMNRNHAGCITENEKRTVSFNENMQTTIEAIFNQLETRHE